jgi:hypothetical protein
MRPRPVRQRATSTGYKRSHGGIDCPDWSPGHRRPAAEGDWVLLDKLDDARRRIENRHGPECGFVDVDARR